MSDYKSIIDQETRNFVEYGKELFNLELNFRTYLSEKGLSEDSFKIAASEYSEAIKTLKGKIAEVESKLEEMPKEDTSYAEKEVIDEMAILLGRIWRAIVMNKDFTINYGGVSFTDEPAENLYKEIYDKHLVELNEFMDYFINVVNTLFSK